MRTPCKISAKSINFYYGLIPNVPTSDFSNVPFLGKFIYGWHENSRVQIHLIPFQLSCCGANSPEDWNSSQWRLKAWSENIEAVPKSCCKTPSSIHCGLRIHPSSISFTVKTRGVKSKLILVSWFKLGSWLKLSDFQLILFHWFFYLFFQPFFPASLNDNAMSYSRWKFLAWNWYRKGHFFRHAEKLYLVNITQ